MTLSARRLLSRRPTAHRQWTLDPTARSGVSTSLLATPQIIRGEIAMDSFVFRPTTWPVLRIFSRNPLIRRSDRIDAAVTPLAVLLVIVSVACAGVLGTVAHDVESHRYLEEAKTRHSVTATAVEDSTPGTLPESSASKVVVRWKENGIAHTDVVTWDQPIKAKAALKIWVDGSGNRVAAPTPPALAGANVILSAAVAWWVMVVIVELSVRAVRARTARMRDDQWEREIRCLVDDEDGRTNRSQ